VKGRFANIIYLCEEFLEAADVIERSPKCFLFAMGGKALLTGVNLQGRGKREEERHRMPRDKIQRGEKWTKSHHFLFS